MYGLWSWCNTSVSSMYANVATENNANAHQPQLEEAPRKRQRNEPNHPNVPVLLSRHGRRYCEDFNNGHCAAGTECPKNPPEIHSCNFVDARGKPCGMLGHRRSDHPHTGARGKQLLKMGGGRGRNGSKGRGGGRGGGRGNKGRGKAS